MSNRIHSVAAGLSLRLPLLLATAGLALLLMVSLGAEPAAPPKEVTNSIGMKLALIPAGKFLMGSPKDEQEHWPNEEQHEVSITKSFYLGVYVVTQAEYEKVMGNNPSSFSAKGDGKASVKDVDTGQFPVEMVSWDDAVAFCKFGGGFAPYTINAPPTLRAGMTKDTSPQRKQGTDRSCTNKIRSE